MTTPKCPVCSSVADGQLFQARNCSNRVFHTLMKCPICGSALTCIGNGSLAVGGIIAPGDVYDCKNRHVWTQVDPPDFILDSLEA